MARTCPALDLRWPPSPGADVIDRALAEIDAESPTAVEHRPDGIRVFFSGVPQRNRAAALLSRMQPPPACTPIDVPDEDWAARSQASLRAVTIDRLVVTPPWDRPAGQTGEIELVVLPSMGFGTGHHASTRLCLRLLQREHVQDARVVDVGTGSGVLALAAAKLGARQVLAVDSDPDALEAAAHNADLNGLTGTIELRTLDVGASRERRDDQFDIVLANLTGALLIRHALVLSGMRAPDGRVIVSGFERHEADDVRDAFRAAGLHEGERLEEEGWVGQTFRSSPIRSTRR